MIYLLLNIIFIILFPLFFLGMVNRVKALWAGRKGPSVIQPFRDFIKLMKKGEVVSTTTSFVFRIAPSVTFGSVITTACVAPLLFGKQIFSFSADFIFFAYVLAAGKFFAIIGAMDTGSSFEGMGASREAAFSSLVEPAFFLIIGSLAFVGKASSFNGLLSLSGVDPAIGIIILFLCASALFIMLTTEGSRVPVDDPNTHLELTMIHEVMVLDNSGPDLGLINYAAGLKMVVVGSLIANLVLSAMDSSGASGAIITIAAFIGVHVIIAVLIGTTESLMARLRMSHIPQFIFFMSSIGIIILAVVVLYVSGGLK
jgi:formate hydrogenlyase subunit 4